jgi:hypothetical protein
VLDLALASAGDFAGCLNERFRLASGGATIELELVAASPVGDRAAADGRREPFALLFRGPSDPVLPQRIYRLECASLGSLDIFLVPIGADAAGIRYEAVFS